MMNLAKYSQIFTLYIFILVSCGVVFAESKSSEHTQHASDQHQEHAKMILRQTPVDDKKWIEEKTGEFLPLELEFIDETGMKVRLSDIIDRPTIFLPIYFYCPNVCSRSLSNLAVALKSLTAVPGKDYRVIALSFNDVEDFEVAARAKVNYLKLAGDGFPEQEWKFLTGTEEAIISAIDSVGFKFMKVDDQTFIHASALMVIGGDGKIIRYVYGSFLPGDIDMALHDAASGVVSLSVKRLLNFCFNYDPGKENSTFLYVKIVVLALFAVGLLFVFIYFNRKKPRS